VNFRQLNWSCLGKRKNILQILFAFPNCFCILRLCRPYSPNNPKVPYFVCRREDWQVQKFIFPEMHIAHTGILLSLLTINNQLLECCLYNIMERSRKSQCSRCRKWVHRTRSEVQVLPRATWIAGYDCSVNTTHLTLLQFSSASPTATPTVMTTDCNDHYHYISHCDAPPLNAHGVTLFRTQILLGSFYPLQVSRIIFSVAMLHTHYLNLSRTAKLPLQCTRSLIHHFPA